MDCGRVRFIQGERSSMRVCVDDKSSAHRRSLSKLSRSSRRYLASLDARRRNTRYTLRLVFALQAPANESRMTGIRLRFRWHSPSRDSAR